MNESAIFQNPDLLWPVMAIGVGLWTLFLWKEQKKPQKKRFFSNMMIALVSILSLAMLALKPLKISKNKREVGILLTDGFDQKQLDSLKIAVKSPKILIYEKNIPIGQVLDSISALHIMGTGVEAYDFWQFENRNASYLLQGLPNGIIRLLYPLENKIGTNLTLKGRFRNANLKDQLVLQDAMGVGLDSVGLNQSKQQEFELTTPLKATGKFVYKLVRKDSLGDFISSEPIPFKVVAPKKIKILVVNSFPAFETKYLKNYLAEMGHEVVVRNRLTRARYKFEYFNRKRTPIYGLNETNLKEFDLLIMDVSSFRNLAKNEVIPLENTIKNDGLGVFIQPSSGLVNLSSEKWGLEFERDRLSNVVLEEFSSGKLEKIPFTFKDKAGLEELHENKNGILTAYIRMQKGRVGSTVLENTYYLQLNGKTRAYRKLWSSIVGTLAKKDELILDWKADERFPLQNNPFQFELRSSIVNPEVFTQDKTKVPLRQSIDITSLWSGITYPSRKGWNQLHLKNEASPFEFYVFDSLAYQSIRAVIRQKRNQRYFSSSSDLPLKITTATVFEPFWFFLISLLGMGYLWLEPKLLQT